MAVNTAALKTFAPAMRRQLMEAVGRKLDLLLNSQTPDILSTFAKQIAELRDEQEKSREQLLERVAYTWFNRLCALRYLDTKGWHPFGCKVLMPADSSETQPELLKLMRSGSLPGDLQAFTNEQRLNQLLDGQIPTAIPGGDAQGEVYRELVLAACRSYHQLLPDLFEGLDDASELLLPDDLLTEGSIAGSFRSSISDSDCDDVEIIGWLYQFYISEKKDEVIGKVVKSEDIPAATQLFTPNWIVKYMVQNTIGAQWLATYPDSPLREQMEYYIEPAEQTDEVKAKLAETTPTSLNPEELTLMDPACGSGHILVEAYEIFKAIYLEQGYQLREIPKLIFEKNLFGLDIDERAAQLSSFCLLMKGRADDRRLFNQSTPLNVMALHDSADFDITGIAEQMNLAEHALHQNDLLDLKNLFRHARTLGSLIQIPADLAEKLPALKRISEASNNKLLSFSKINHLRSLTRQATILSKEYDAIVENPPYMGSGGMNQTIKEIARHSFPEAKTDLFSCFISRSIKLLTKRGSAGVVAPYVWMFLSSYEQFRKTILKSTTLTTLVQLEYNAFEPACIPVAAFTLRRKNIPKTTGTFIKLSDFTGHINQAPKTLEAIRNPACEWLFNTSSEQFESIPGSPIAYWLSKSMTKIFTSNDALKSHCYAGFGIKTGNNEIFLRKWHEVDTSKLELEGTQDSNFSNTWYPCASGGDFRRWFGNRQLVVNYRDKGVEIEKFAKENGNSYGFNGQQYYFRESITWPKLTSSDNSFRYTPSDSIFDGVGLSAFFDNEESFFGMIAALNTQAYQKMINTIAPTLSFTSGDFLKLPFPKLFIKKETQRIAKILIEHSRNDWDEFERSWDFKTTPLLRVNSEASASIEKRYKSIIGNYTLKIKNFKQLEEESNQIFIETYGLTDELVPEVPIEEITLTINPAYRYGGDATEEEKWERFQRDSMAELLSYATGCMMGRYSLDHPGLILADSRSNQDEQLAAYEAKIGKAISEIQFKPDADAIIPVLDGEWFEDDIVSRTREFLRVTFPESSIAENLRFIEESIGKDIRKHFCKDFYKDHLQTYKKRPIYWMVQSPKAGFACLIYLHRYTPDTLLQVLNNYFRPYLQKLEARQEQLERDQNNDALPKREQTAARKEAEKITKVLKECQAWEQDALLPLAQQRIELDLDDGVKVNYLKLQEVLQKIPGLASKGD